MTGTSARRDRRELKAELIRAEDRAFAEVHDLVHRLTPAQLEQVGYQPGWSVKDLLGHLASWCSEAARHLEQIRLGTYGVSRDEPSIDGDLDELNRRFFEASRDLSLDEVRAEWAAARYRMLQEWDDLEEPDGDALFWFRGSGPEHYEEHVPRLREWVAELTAE